MEGESCLTCNVCRVAYASDQELQEHNWSLMHHIKIEQTKKGAPHSCSLCMETCANIIEYGKHLNADKHKMALSRQMQGGSDQMLNSLGLIPPSRPVESLNRNEPQNTGNPYVWNRKQTEPFSQRSRSFSRPSSVKQDEFKHPADSSSKRPFRRNEWRKGPQNNKSGRWPKWDGLGGQQYCENTQRFNDEDWISMDDVMQDWMKRKQGQNGSSVERGQHNGRKSPNFDHRAQNMHHNRNTQYFDDSSGFDPENNCSFAHQPEMNDFPDQWADPQSFERWDGSRDYGQSYRRRGSFDEGLMSQGNGNGRRGRGILRGRHHNRTSSYDYNRRSRSNEDRFSPESNSSTDSNGLKRPLEDGEVGVRGKSRRTNSIKTSDVLHSGDSILYKSSSLNDHSSRERSADRDFKRRSRSHSDSSRRVTWSDQQSVSSTTDEGVLSKVYTKSSSSGKTKSLKSDLVAAVPDSSTEIKKKKKKDKNGGKKGGGKFKNFSGSNQLTESLDGTSNNKGSGSKDSTESVLEKAEKLCKKLRSEREKVKQQKLKKEKQKKIEKTEELNTQLAELSKENLKKITGHLDTAGSATNKDLDKFFDTENSLNELHKPASQPKVSQAVTLTIDHIKNSLPNVAAPVVRTATSPMTTGDTRVAERIAQTRADIDAIRAKIEGSVDSENRAMTGLKKPSPAHGLSPLGNIKSPTNNKSLLKMVNAPRTTKERLHVAQLLRNHAKSQSKYSFPRFNLKMSDLVENHSEIDEDLTEFSLESLTPSVQLEIANLIEADIKPDVAELQFLLDAASSENAELDLNVLSDLGISQSPVQSVLSPHTPNIRAISPLPGRQRTLSADSQPSRSISTAERDNAGVPDMGRSRSPVGTTRAHEQRREPDDMNDRPSLSVEELVTQVNKAKEHMLGVREWDKKENGSCAVNRSENNLEDGVKSRFSSSMPILPNDTGNMSRLSSSLHNNSNLDGKVKVKVEKEDYGYGLAENNNVHNYTPTSNIGAGPAMVNRDSSLQGPAVLNRDSGPTLSSIPTPDVSKIRRSVHTKGLYPSNDELPVRDTDRVASNSGRQGLNGDKQSSSTDRFSLNTTTEIQVSSTTMQTSNANRLASTTDRLSSNTSLQTESNSTVDRVNAILNAVPNIDNMFSIGQTTSQSSSPITSLHSTLPKTKEQSPIPTAAYQHSKPSISLMPKAVGLSSGHSMAATGALTTDQLVYPSVGTGHSVLPTLSGEQPVHEKDKQLDSSVNSNSSSVLDQVYSICMEEENVRSEMNSVDAKIDKLKSLITEAQLQLNSFTEKKKELTVKESQFRTSRIRLLQENRSLDGSSGSQNETNPSFTTQLSEAQIQNLNNPVLMKFLMSQRQSDVSSVGGYSNVESGSQTEDCQYSQRRGSMTSVTSSGVGEPVSSAADTQKKGNQNQLFSQSIDILTGSTETLASLQSEKAVTKHERDSGTPIPMESAKVSSTAPTSTPQDNIQPKSLSLLKNPMDNFVTLKSLLDGDTEIGKLIHKSLESIQRGEVKQEEEMVIKTPEVVGSGAKGAGDFVRVRQDSVLSVGSDDMCISGSDTDKRAGKVSMKYMGTLHEGANYDSIMKQISSGGKNKPIMFTVLSSPEPIVTGKPQLGFETTESPLVSAEAARKGSDAKSNVLDLSYLQNKSPRSDTTSTTIDLTEVEVHSARSNFSLGEQIKMLCDGHADIGEQKRNIVTPRSESSGEKTLEDESVNKDVHDKEVKDLLGMKDCGVKLDRMDVKSISPKPCADTSVDSNSPIRKRLKSKRERDQKSRRKAKETFILLSDTNSDDDKGSQNSRGSQNSKSTGKTEEVIVLTGSEDANTPRPSPVNTAFMKKSLLDEVQLETETFSESGEDKSSKQDGVNRLTIQPEKRDSSRTNVKSNQLSNDLKQPVEYKGPPLSVMAIQLFKGGIYVCYNGSELRRFDLKTGKILRELDCSPYLVNCLHVTSVEEREDILYTTGACKKLMLFNPNNFSLITTYPYSERITCLHENWGRLFIGMVDGSVGVRSLKTDKELNHFFCTAQTIHCLTSASAGMTKMLCLGTGDKIIYVLDAISGLLITMLEGHTQPPLCIQVMGEIVISGSADHTILVHKALCGELLKRVATNKPLLQLWTDGSNIYASSQDQIIRVYDSSYKLRKLHQAKDIVTYGMIKDGMMFTGHRNGMVEAVPVSSIGAK